MPYQGFLKVNLGLIHASPGLHKGQSRPDPCLTRTSKSQSRTDICLPGLPKGQSKPDPCLTRASIGQSRTDICLPGHLKVNLVLLINFLAHSAPGWRPVRSLTSSSLTHCRSPLALRSSLTVLCPGISRKNASSALNRDVDAKVIQK
jgi:hypothetical protein